MSASALPTALGARLRAAIRPAGAIAVLLPWLVLVSSWQTVLYPAVTASAQSPIPPPVVVAAIAVAAGLRVVRRSTPVHVLLLAVIACGAALLAAQIGTPFANASGDYCGDFCRTAMLGRALSFAAWPVVTASAFGLLGQLEARSSEPGSADRAAWSMAWAGTTLVLGLVASLAWWRVILPPG